MATVIRKSTYGNYQSGNYGVHAMRLNIGCLSFWFSYDTVVAFQSTTGYYVSENCWGPTTGKHINAIDGGGPGAKKARLPRGEFEAKLAEVLKRHGLDI